jgi:RHS repeat-associated protein
MSNGKLLFKQDNFEYKVPGRIFELTRGMLAGGGGSNAPILVNPNEVIFSEDTGEHLWSIPRGDTSANAAIQADLSHATSGKYNYKLTVGNRRLSGTPGSIVISGINGPTVEGELIHVNKIDSPFGSGWSISGWQEIVENQDGSILLIDGDGEEKLFTLPETKDTLGTSNPNYISPEGDFSSLEKLADGTFHLTTKDQMVYSFNQNNQLSSIQDRNGNTTQYIYDENERLIKIIDPVALETQFVYNDLGKVSKIIDPANKETLLNYDQRGNLISVSDPNSSTRTWEYDSKHHMIAETDQRGNREQAFYNFAGRASKAINKDGSEIKVAPVQMEGLYSPESTAVVAGNSSITTIKSQAQITSSYADKNGNVEVTVLDGAGQEISKTDGEGKLPSVERDSRNLITSSTDSRGNETEYVYDEQGNVINISRPLSEVTKVDTNSSILTQIEYPTGSSPQTLNFKDLNLDGNNDLITFNGNKTFSVLNGDEANIFQPKQDYSIPGTKDSSFLADLNEDGYSEVVSLDNNGNLSLRNGGETGFSTLKTYNSINLNNTAEISFAQPDYTQTANNLDFLADTSKYDFLNLVAISGNKPFKQPDYIDVANPQPSTLSLKLNADNLSDRVTLGNGTTFSVELANADGTFAAPRNYSFQGGEDSLITAGDINNDGKEDILVASRKFIVDATRPGGGYYQSYLNTFRGKGDGTLLTNTFYTGVFSEPYSYPEAFVLKDIERDGLLDWIAYDRDQKEVRPIRYDPATGQVFWFTPTLTTEPKYIAVGDFVERYNSQDVIATDATKTQLSLVSFYTTRNDFDIFKVYDPDSLASVRRSSHTLTNSSDYVAVEDLDKDTRSDWITVAEDRSQVDIYLKNSNGTNKSQNTINFQTIPDSVNLGDLNEDGNYDLLAVYEATGDFLAYFGNGNGTFAAPVAYNLPGNYDTPILRDVDDDGNEDLIAVATEASGNKTFSVFLDDGTGNYSSPFSYTFAGNNNSFVLKDLDADGDEDLVGVNSLNKRITVVTNQNNTSFVNATSYNLTNFEYLSFQDLDGDKDLDLLTATENQKSFSLSLNQGNGSFGTAVSLNFADSVQNLALKDLNGDNRLDALGTFDTNRQKFFTALGKADGSFGATTTYTTSVVPNRLLFRDLDKNGVEDLVAFNTAGSQVEVFLTYETTTNGVVSRTTNKQTYTTAIAPSEVGFADLDFDSDLDLIVTNSSKTAYSMRLNSNGVFNGEYRTTVNLTQAPAHLSLTNIDGINGLDLLVANEDKSQFSVLLNKGDATFSTTTNFNFSTNLTNRTWRDVNADGISDLISTNSEHSAVSIFLGIRDGSFSAENVYQFTNNPTYVSIGDLDGNSQPDVIGINQNRSQVTTIKTNADGTKTLGNNYPVGIKSANNLTVDLDGDGDADSVTVNPNGNTVTVKRERGDGTFEPDVNYTVGNKPVAVVAEDANGDGKLDIIAANSNSNNISILYGIGNGAFANSLTSTNATGISGHNRPFDTQLFDLNGDSYLDLIAADYQRDRVSVLLGTEDGTFTAETNYQVGDGVYAVEIADLDGDNHLDLVTSNYLNHTVSVLLGIGNGTFGVATNYAAGNNPFSVAIDDFNADGILDLVTANYGNRQVSVLLGTGNGSFASFISYSTTYSSPTDVEIGDFNRDGKSDLVVSEYFGYLSILLGNGNGEFTNSTSYSVGGRLNDVQVADLNKDGFSDLVTARDGNASVFYGQKDGTFDGRKDYASGNFLAVDIQVTDLNGDTLPEIVVNSGNNDVSILKNRGNKNFKLQLNRKLSSNSLGLVVGDVDGNELGDLAGVSYSGDGKSLEVTTTTSSLFNEQVYQYDPTFNQVTSETDELGRKTLYSIDPHNGNRLSETRVVGQVGGDDDVVTTYTYTDAGLVDTMTDPLGRVTDYQYDRFGRLIKETSAKGTEAETVRQYEYDAAGNQTAVIDENGNRTEYEYDQLNRVTKTIKADPDGAGELTSPVATFDYDEVGNVIKTVDANNNVTSNEYDELNRLTKTTDALGQSTDFKYDEAGNLIELTDGLGRKAQSVYDSRNRLIEIIDPLGGSTLYEYDADDNLIATVDPNGNKTHSEYDARNRLTRTIDAEGNITNYEYDGADNLIATVDGNGNRTEYEYDDLDRQVKRIDALGGESTTVYDQVGNVIATTDEEGRTTELAYDGRDRLVQTTNAEDGVASFAYDDVGNLTSVTDELNRTTNYEYDALNRQIGVEDPLGNTNQTSYDGLGNLTSTTDGKGNIIHYAYDKLNRLSVVTNPFGDKLTTSYDAVGNVTSVTDELRRTTHFTYDERNLQTSITDPLGHISTTKYDAVGQAIALTDPLGNKTSYSYDDIYRLIATTDAENRTTNYEYDPVGNLLSLTDPEENTTSYTYDELNRMITDTNQLGDTRTYGYDKVGNQIRSRDRNGRVINYAFDKLNRNTGEVWLDETGNPIHTFEFEYDAASQLLNAHDSNSAYGYEYDDAGRLVEVDNAGTPDAPNVVLNYGYDAANNLIEVKDKIDGVNKGVETFAYDELNRVTSITQSGNGVSEKRVDMSYDAASQMTGMSRYSDLTGTNLIAESNYTFDENGRLTNLTHNQDGDVLSAYEWAYDQANRITQATSPDGVSDYDYDKSDQLVDADHSYQDDEAYSYDDNGNRVNAGYVTGENNQLTSDGKYNYEYDKEGNRTKRTEITTGEVTNYQWDYRNRLTGVVTKNSSGSVIKQADYAYDVFDNRIAKSVDADGSGVKPAVVERFVYDGDHIALTFDGEGHQTERFLHGTQIDQILAQENANGEVLWALTDNLGSVRMLLDNNGNVVNNITYDAFGNITLETHPDVNFRFGYTGRELDAETGLYNYRSRYYDPELGEFVSEDTIGFAGGDANLSRYVGNNPLNRIDPFGFCGVPSPAGPEFFGPAFGPDSSGATPVPGDKTIKVAGPITLPGDDLLGDDDDDDGTYKLPEPPVLGDPDLGLGLGLGLGFLWLQQAIQQSRQDHDDDDDDDDDVFRGDLRPPAIIKQEGFQPKNPNGNLSLEDHVDYIDPDNSQWVSTSTDEQSAAGFGTESDRNPPFETKYGWVYRINRPPGGVNVNEAMGLSSSEAEIAFPGGIPPQYIKGYKKILGESPSGDFILDTYKNINE